MAKRKTKFWRILLCAVLALILALGTTLLFYLPHYVNNKEVLAMQTKPTEKITVMSYNIRCATPTDLGKRSWLYRADMVMQNIKDTAPDIIGFQEVMAVQNKHLASTLPDYDHVMQFRDNSIASEGCPIYYRRDLFTLVDKGSFWLSETPDEISRGWGAACHRICSYVILVQKATGKEFVVFNTHLDHVSEEARENGIALVLQKIAEFGGMPAVLMGDFNASEDSDTYRTATGSFLDVKYQTQNTMQAATYQAWGEKPDEPCIDYIMISKTGFSVAQYAVVQNTYNDVYPSDHFPLLASLLLD